MKRFSGIAMKAEVLVPVRVGGMVAERAVEEAGSCSPMVALRGYNITPQ